MVDWPILSLVTFLPLVGAVLIALTPGNTETGTQNSFLVALLTSIATFIVSLFVWAFFDASNPEFQMVEKHAWLARDLFYHMGVDGISVLFVVLTAFLVPFCVLTSWGAIKKRGKEYLIAFLVLETFTIGAFLALDTVLFFVFFEAGLIPLFLIIGIWGGKDRVYASYKFFLYTLLGSLLMLLGIIALYWQVGTTDITQLLKADIPENVQFWLWLAFFAAFAVKMPMWPFHTWLPDAHVQAPTAGSVILAGILLKLGGYGFLRFSLPMFTEASHYFAPFVLVLSVIAIIYASLVALMQTDIKKVIAYSSVAHMGFVTLGIFTFNIQGIQGAIFQMISHGLVSGALFLCVGVVYERAHTRDISDFGGLANILPKFAVVLMVFTMANVGLPGTAGFVGEFLTLLASFRANTIIALFATTGVILSASYSLWLYRRVMFGALEKESLKNLPDLTRTEKLMLYPLVALVLFFGIYTAPIMDTIAASTSALVSQIGGLQ